MKPRLFWTMLFAFILVIALGICGMLSFFALTVAGPWEPQQPHGAPQASKHEQALAASLADYYAAHGGSWSGVEQRLTGLNTVWGRPWLAYVLVDAEGRVVASNDPGTAPGERLGAQLRERGQPVVAQGARVGTLLERPGGPPWTNGDAGRSGPPAFFWPVLRNFLLAGLGLAGVLLLLAVLFAQRLSRPIRRLTAAAQTLASGRLDVQVGGASVRELDELAQSFNHMAGALAEADRQRRQMTADVAHELRTPLTIIRGRLEGLQDGVYPATAEEVGRLQAETALLERLIEDLRLLALAEAGQLPLYREAIEPRELLEDTAAAFADQAAAQEVALQIEAAQNLPRVSVDPQRMAQVFANLVTNALRYSPAGHTVTLMAARASPAALPEAHALQQPGSATREVLLMQVRDTGAGISAEDLPRLFDRFWRADPSRARHSGGSGLGLAIAKQIVVAHGGAIWAASARGQGTTISIALPAADE